jgi:hypothetical protein
MAARPELDRFLSLAQAARQFGLAEETLRSLIDSRRLKGAVLPNGEIGVSERGAEQTALSEKINEQLRAVRQDDFRQLQGVPITISDAAAKYDLLDKTLRDWIKRGNIGVLEVCYRKRLNEADVAFCARVYHIRKLGGSLSGAALLDETGRPNLLKHPNLSEYRRKKRLIG